MTDLEISDAVEDELMYDPVVTARRLDVAASEGVVTLTGTLDNLLAKDRAERLAETVRGVRAVVNLVEVVPPDDRPDTAVRRDVEEALLLDPAAEAFEIDVEVEEGVVTLAGTVESRVERDLAERVARSVRGVTEVRSEIVVEPRSVRYDLEIQQEIEEALRWDALVDHALIDVEVEDGRVTLRGVVGSAAEKREARYDAWVAGVRSVDTSDLTVARWARDEDLRANKYVSVADPAIEAALETALLYDPRVLSGNVAVSSEDGVVTLRGTVEGLRALRAAGEVARNTVGVTFVENRLKVRPADPPTDEEIAHAITAAFRRDPYLEADPIHVRVLGGIAILTGSVPSRFQRAHADGVAARVLGVVEVENLLDVAVTRGRPLLYNPYVSGFDPGDLNWVHYDPPFTHVPDDQIEASIEGELYWSPFVDLDDITVTVEDGVATLTGTVSSLRELEDATENAYEGGAVWVDNQLIVVDSDGAS
jgi:osmotically-inducible protein OsmY